jgi:hypothetical protein
MKLSENTVNILKNYASINPMLLVKEGNVLATVSVARSILAKATVEESFPRQFAIYELPRFLGVLSLFNDPEIEFGEKQLRIVSGRQSVNYTYADPSMIVSPPERQIVFPGAEVEFTLSQQDLQKLVRATGVLQLKSVVVIGNGQTISIAAASAKNPSADSFSIEVGETDKQFEIFYSTENIIKLISAEYSVKISKEGLTQFVSTNVEYFMASEAGSTYTSAK